MLIRESLEMLRADRHESLADDQEN